MHGKFRLLMLLTLTAVCTLLYNTMNMRLHSASMAEVAKHRQPAPEDVRGVLEAGTDGAAKPAAPTPSLDPKPSNSKPATAIPRIFHQTFTSELLYENYKPLINSCLTLNPDWTYYLWRDTDAEALVAVEYPEFLPQYRRYTHGLEKSDSIRYIVLHHFGGIYLDMDVECRQPFFPSLAAVHSFLDQERIEQTNIIWNKPFSVMNSAMGSAPGHPFFRLMIDELRAVSKVGRAISSTGPEILTRVYDKYVKSRPAMPIRLLEPRIMSPLMASNANWTQLCSDSVPSKSAANQSWKQRGCQTLQQKNWRMDDTDSSTICVHRFLHLGYEFGAGARKALFNATLEFWPRVHFFYN